MFDVPESNHANSVSFSLWVSHWICLLSVVVTGHPLPGTSAIVLTSKRRIASTAATKA